MSKRRTERAETNQAMAITKSPRSLRIANRGIKTAFDFANLMSALMSDLIEGRVTPQVGNATCNTGGKLLKVVEMQYKYGTNGPGNGKKVLVLAVGEDLGNGGERRSGD